MSQTNFQTAINTGPSQGVAGDRASLNPAVYTVGNPLADGPVNTGSFVWPSANGAANTGTGAPLGYVERVIVNYNYDVLSGATMAIASGCALTVARKGDYYAVSATVATDGQKVFAVLADGNIKTGAAGATVVGAVETNWHVVKGGPAGELITISNWS
ncbi:MAG: hypothetical protein RRY29_03805 [Desulfovibrionaceae bacterium]